MKDGNQVATMPMEHKVNCVAASQDGRWIAAGTRGDLVVWNTATYEQAFAGRTGSAIWDIDFSPDSSHLVSADSDGRKATVWDLAARRGVQTLSHWGWVRAAKYSPQGDRIAAATEECIRVWDSDDGRLLVDVKVRMSTEIGNLFWNHHHLFGRTKDGTVKQIDAVTGSTISEWPIPDPRCSRITLLQHGNIIACSGNKTITFWDTTTRSQLGLIPHTHNIRSIACSSDGQLAIAGGERVVVNDLSPVIFRSFSVCSMSYLQSISQSHLTFQGPELDIGSAALNAWKHGQLVDAEVLLSRAIPTYHVLASRALVRARLGEWDAAIADAEEVHVVSFSHAWSLIPFPIKSITIRRSLVGYVAKGVALVGKGEKDKGIRVCDISFRYFHSEHVSFLLLFKVCDFARP